MKKLSSLTNSRTLFWLGALAFILLLLGGFWMNQSGFSAAWSNFATVFLGIFIEAIPFLLLGTLASGLVDTFIQPDTFQRLLPKSTWGSVVLGALMGLAFPVCECGVVPLVRRLYKKGLPLSSGIAFLLAAPVINPVVILSTAAAYGLGKMLWMRIGFTFLVAFITGLIFSTVEDPAEILKVNHFDKLSERPDDQTESDVLSCGPHAHGTDQSSQASILARLGHVMQVAMNELFEMGRFLVIGALISAGMQTFIPQTTLLKLGGGVLSSVLVMIALAILLSICSTVDAFISLSFLGTFTSASVLSFLLYGPMVDIKSVLMFTAVFKKRAVMYLLLIPLVLVILIGVTLNTFWI